MREEFEKLPEVAELIKDYKIKFNEDFSLYVSLLVHKSQCDYVNGAWYAFQEQQKKIDAVLEFIDSDELGHDARLGDFYRDIEELLK